MSALWGRADREGAVRPLVAACVECGWRGEEHHEPDSEAVRFAASDAAAHNAEVHAKVPEGALF